MIITCEKCNSSFYVQDKKIPDDGRKVRCAKCAHTWHQMPESDPDLDSLDAKAPDEDKSEEASEAAPDEASEDAAAQETAEEDAADEKEDQADEEKAAESDAESDGDDEQSEAGTEDDEKSESGGGDEDLINALGLMADENTKIEQEDDGAHDDVSSEPEGNGSKKNGESGFSLPDGIKPLKFSKDSLPVDISNLMSEKNIGHAVNYGSPVAVFLVVFILLVFTKGIWVNAMPSMAGFYNFFGVGVHTTGVGLVFEDVKVQPLRHKDTSRSLVVTGRILNKAKRDTKVPVIKAQASQLDGTVINEWYVMPERTELSTAESMSFETTLENASKNIDEVSVKFALLDVDIKKDDHKSEVSHSDGGDEHENADKHSDKKDKHDKKDDAHH